MTASPADKFHAVTRLAHATGGLFVIGALLITPFLMAGQSTVGRHTLQALLLVAAGLHLVGVLLARRRPMAPASILVAAAIILSVGWFMTLNANGLYSPSRSLIRAIDAPLPFLPGSSEYRSSLRDLLTVTGLLGVILLVIELSRRLRWRLALLMTIALAGCLLAVVGLLERATLVSLYAPHMDRGEGIYFASFNYHAAAGTFLNMSLPALLVLPLVATNPRIRVALIAAVVPPMCLIITAVILSKSRGSLVLMLVTLFAAALLTCLHLCRRGPKATPDTRPGSSASVRDPAARQTSRGDNSTPAGSALGRAPRDPASLDSSLLDGASSWVSPIGSTAPGEASPRGSSVAQPATMRRRLGLMALAGLGVALAFGAMLFTVQMVEARSAPELTLSQRWSAFYRDLSATQSRPAMWREAARLAIAAGPLGSGPGTFTATIPDRATAALFQVWQVERFSPSRSHAHQDYLQTVVEWGWIGGAAWGVIILGGFYGAVRTALSRTAEPTVAGPAIVVAAALTGALIHGTTDFPWQIPVLRMYICVYAALGISLWTTHSRTPGSTGSAEGVTGRIRVIARRRMRSTHAAAAV